MTSLGTITYTVEVETDKVIKGTNAADKQFDKLDDSMSKVDSSSKALTSNLSKLSAAIGAVIAANALRDMAEMVQKYQEMSERVQMATSSQAEFEAVQKRLLATANGTYRSLQEAQELYIRTADSLRSMGYSTQQALDVTDSLSYAFVKNATSADRADGAIAALAKSVNKGKVEADAWETVIAAVPTVINDIAIASGKTAAEVRALGAAGNLSAKDLTEGLRKALTANAEAAAGMSNNLVDASVRTKTAITAVLVEIENQTGGLQTLTDGIISAADAMLSFGGDSEKVANFLTLTTAAATSLAAVIAGRLVGATVSYGLAQGVVLKNAIAQLSSATAVTGANLMLAKAENDAAQAALAQAKASNTASIGVRSHGAAAAALAAAEARAATATLGLNAALSASASVATVGTTAMTALKTAMTFLGGPAGVIFLAASALVYFANSAKTTKVDVDALNGSLNKLGFYQLAKSANDTQDDIKKLNVQLSAAMNDFNTLTKRPFEGEDNFKKRQTEARAELERVNGELTTRRDLLANIAKRQEDLAKAPAAAASGPSAEPTLIPSAEEIKATETATKSLGEATKKKNEEEAKGNEENLRTIDSLQEAIYQATLSTEELAARKAELSLNEYASPEDIETVKALGVELEKLNVLQAKRKEFGSTPEEAAKKVTGTVDPLSGGAFDNQAARYQAEADAEMQRYADQLTRLNEAKILQIEVLGGYQTLEEQMAQQHADRMNQIDTARNEVLLSSAEKGFGGVADIMKMAFGEQSALYKVAFVAQKAAAIASATIAIQQGIALAAANPWPLNLAAMASVAAASASLVGNIASVAAPGRAIGGPVQADGMYRINETGAPEIFNASNGRQYMMPNSRGEVVSNKDATSGGGGSAAPIVNVNNYSGQAATSTSKFSEADRAWVIDVVVGDGMGDGKTGRMINSLTGTRRQGS